MAYVAFARDEQDAALNGAITVPPARFSALEWTVVALAGKDPLSSLRAPGRLSVALGTIFGGRSNPRLADPRLEALRRMAVLTWHHGYQAPLSAIRAFIDSGFTADHFELLAASIGTAQRGLRARRLAA